jgi:hypothetical protein
VVDRIDWEMLTVHADAPVRKLAAEQLGKDEKKPKDASPKRR